jgi:hypothetical protein
MYLPRRRSAPRRSPSGPTPESRHPPNPLAPEPGTGAYTDVIILEMFLVADGSHDDDDNDEEEEEEEEEEEAHNTPTSRLISRYTHPVGVGAAPERLVDVALSGLALTKHLLRQTK